MKNKTTAWQLSLKIFKWSVIFLFIETILGTFSSKIYNTHNQLILLFSFMIVLFIYKLEENRVVIYNKFHSWYSSLELSKNFFILKFTNFFKNYSFVGILSFLFSLKVIFLSLVFVVLAKYFDFSSELNGSISLSIYFLLYLTFVFALASKMTKEIKKDTFANFSFIGIVFSIFLLNFSGLSSTFSTVKHKVETPSAVISLKKRLNLTLPKDVIDVEELDVYSDFFMGATYEKFGYKAPANFFTILSKHDKYPRKDYKNSPIHKVSCDDFFNNSFFNTVTKNSECYFGVLYPYYHNIVYDPTTKDVEDVVGYYYW